MTATYTKEELMQIVRDAWTRVIKNVDPGLGLAICHHESGWDPNARSKPSASDEKYGGAYGLCQILPPTAKDLGFTGAPEELFNPHINAWLLASLTLRNSRVVGTGLRELIAAHNCGAAAVQRGKIPAETNTIYVPTVLKLYLNEYATKRPSDAPAPLSTKDPASGEICTIE